MRNRALVLASSIFIAGAISAQTATNGTIPDNILYRALFQRVAAQKALADRVAAQGKNDSAARTALRDQAGLSATEYAILESTALDYLKAHYAYFAAQGQILQAIKSAGVPSTSAQKSQLAALAANHVAMEQANIDQLRTALGARFQTLDAWARSAILPNVGLKPMKGVK